MNNHPLISVLMSAYNAEKFIKTAIQSILDQTFTDFEFIIINDGSTDRTLDIVNSFNDNRIIVINNKQNQGISYSLNKGIKISQGEYIARMDADDESLPKRFALQIDFLKKNPQIGVLGTAIFSNSRGKVKISRSPNTNEKCMDRLFSGVCVYQPTVMIRKEVLLDKQYNTNYCTAEDYKLWSDLAQQGVKFSNLSEPLLRYNWHGENISITESVNQDKNRKLVQREYLLFSLTDNEKNRFSKEVNFITGFSQEKILLSNLYNLCLILKCKSYVRSLIRKSIRRDPKSVVCNISSVAIYWIFYCFLQKTIFWIKRFARVNNL